MRCLLLLLWCGTIPLVAAELGYYRQPTIHGDTILFLAEGDVWRVPVSGGQATRLTTHAGEEGLPALAPDGKTVAFTASYDGPTEVYTMPANGGVPTRRTWDSARISHVGWTPDGKLLVGTDIDATLPNQQLAILDLQTKTRTRVPLAQAADGSFHTDGTLYFTRLPFQGSQTKRYQGGTAQQLWKFNAGDAEAMPLTKDYNGTSKAPMVLGDRVYFLTDRTGTMNVWSMNRSGKDLKQHTKHDGFDVMGASAHGSRIVYQHKADLRMLDVQSGQDTSLTITLHSDFDHMRPKVIAKPAEAMGQVAISPNGDRVAVTARGKVFVASAGKGRLIEVTRKDGVRYRLARFMPDGKSLVVLSDQSGEVELWKLPANGIGEPEQLTKDGDVLRWDAVPSPDGKFIAHHDKNQRLWLYDVEKKTDKKIDESPYDGFEGLKWSPDSQWLAYASEGENMFRRVKLHRVSTGVSSYLTTDRYDSFSPAWDPTGKFIYFLSNRNLNTVVPSPWGIYQPEPFFDKKTKIYHVAVQPGYRSPFLPKDDTLDPEPTKKELDLNGIEKRIVEVPVAPGNYTNLSANDKALFWVSQPTGGRSTLLACSLAEKPSVNTVADEISSYELTKEGNKLLIRKREALHVGEATATAGLGSSVDLSSWLLTIKPREEWRQMFADAWRLERDYFYDRAMHGTKWVDVRKKYEPLVERVTSRAELNDLIAQMVAELSALHIFVRGGDIRRGTEELAIGSLGARLERDAQAGGYRIAHIYQHDPDEPQRAGPLLKPGVKAKVGDIIEAVNGVKALDVPDLGELLAKKAGQPVLLKIKSGDKSHETTVRPISHGEASDLRYHEWEYTRRIQVDTASKNSIGYVHLRAMGSTNFAEFAKDFYPAFTRQGLIIDVRHNRGGNIDSWLLSRLLRKAWFYWNQRVGRASSWNMQQAFRGHVVVLCDEFTASDGEAFSEGVKRLNIGKVIGTRTWGGEIWLSSSNTLVDGGIATAAEFGVFSPDGIWLIEGHGVEPDIVVDNLPHATFKGQDAQLEKALEVLQKLIKDDPRTLPPVPKTPTPAKR